MENTLPRPGSILHHLSRGIPSDNEGIASFTEPLGERVKRRHQQHKIPPRSSSGASVGGSDSVKNISSKSGSKNSGSKRVHEDTSSEISFSPKRDRRCGGNHRRHRLASSDSDDDDINEEKPGGLDGDGGGASSSSCLTDSPVPRKHSLQRLVEEAKSRPPPLPRIDGLRVCPQSSYCNSCELLYTVYRLTFFQAYSNVQRSCSD